jgi:hypothetical protein
VRRPNVTGDRVSASKRRVEATQRAHVAQSGAVQRGLGLIVFLVLVGRLPGQSTTESYRVYDDHPRLFLRSQKLKLLRRERVRESLRWQQFDRVISSGVELPEPAFSNALYFRVTDDTKAADRAIAAALQPDADVRQIALVYDWCYDQLKPPDRSTLRKRLERAAADRSGGRGIADLRSQTLAAIAVATADASPEAALRFVVHDEFSERILPAVKSGALVLNGQDIEPLFELLHAVRDNFRIDLRETAGGYFKTLPLFSVLSYYPAPWPAADNEFHIPFSTKAGEPDLRVAALSRAAEMMMVALDSNAPESQVVQGWLTDDRFLMRGPFGIPYEFLWANPYQPGLSYYHVPLAMHDELLGQFAVRSSWDDDARWAGMIEGVMEEFSAGQVHVIDPHTPHQPIDLDEAAIHFAGNGDRFQSGSQTANDDFLVGLDPASSYHVEVDDEEMYEVEPDRAGTVFIKGLRPGIGIRFSRRSEHGDLPAATGR